MKEMANDAAGSGTDPRPYRRLMVPLDGTPFAEAALRPAAELASRAGASIHLVTVFSQNGAQMVTLEPTRPADSRPPEELEDFERYLNEVRDHVQAEWACPASAEVVSGIRPADLLVAQADQIDADLIIAATHARSLIATVFTGSTALDLVRSAPCPVMLIPSDDPTPTRAAPLQGTVRSVVAALDLRTPGDAAVLRHALTCARLWDAELELVHVVEPASMPTVEPTSTPPATPSIYPVRSGEDQVSVDERMEALSDEVQRRGFAVRHRVLRGRRAADAISGLVADNGADLIVIGHHDRNFLERLVLGSESERLARRIGSTGLLICPAEDVREGPLQVG